MNHCGRIRSIDSGPGLPTRNEGFSLVEFLLSTLVLLIVAASSFSVLVQAERTAGTQTNMNDVLNNARIAVETISRIIQQAGNNPMGASFDSLTLTSATELTVRADLTGSAGAGNPNKGDPDGDVADGGETVTIRYNSQAQTIELLEDMTTQSLAGNVSAFLIQYFDRNGNSAFAGGDVTRVRITLTVTSPLPDAQTGRPLSMQLGSDIQIAARQ
jgi:Tfp pilus assembly protein PilW